MPLFYFCITISYITFLPIVNPHAIPVDIGITIKPFHVKDNVIELDVVALMATVSNDSIIVVDNLYFFIFLV